MTAAKQVRWVCPSCGAGKLAPSRPRRDDVRRFCLPCSSKSGRLVERSAPSLERKRAAARDGAAAKRAAEREKQAEREKARRMAGEFDLLDEARRFWRVPTMVDARKRYRPRATELPSITWRRSASKWYTSGRCWPRSQRIVITIGTHVEDARSVLLHELVHAVLPEGEHHGTLFKSTLRSAAREAGVAVR